MGSLFWVQFWALFKKNWIVLWRHPLLNILRCFLLPVIYGAFLSIAPRLFEKPSVVGIGDPIPVHTLSDRLNGAKLVWLDSTPSPSSPPSIPPSSKPFPSPSEIVSAISSDLSSDQLSTIVQIDSIDDITKACPQNFALRSECFAVIVFNELPAFVGDVNGKAEGAVNYTIRADAGANRWVDVKGHGSDMEKTILPLQWAVDRAIIELTTGAKVPTPLEWPYTQFTEEEQKARLRASYNRGIREIVVLAFFLVFVGVVYHIPGSVAAERSALLTSHMKAMGLLDSARVVSWHLSISLAYFPAWIITAVIWYRSIFSLSNPLIILIINVLTGLSLTSFSLFLTAPFSRSPQLAAVIATFVVVLLAIVTHVASEMSTAGATITSLLLPPSFWVYAIRGVTGWENNGRATNMVQPDPDKGIVILPLIVANLISIFMWPFLGAILEEYLYDVQDNTKSWLSKFKGKKSDSVSQEGMVSEGVAISIKNMRKEFATSVLRPSKNRVTAVADLSFDVPKYGIFVLLGSNGAGKSTTLSILGRLSSHTAGTVLYENGLAVPPRGTLGIVPQKNVLFPELTCRQTLAVWKSIKWTPDSDRNEDIVQLLRDCDLGIKIDSNAGTMSGGQKRKLQLAIGLVGGSKVVLVDECTSGVDPLSRRALWKTLTTYREERTIVYTTHFLDEADLLADNIAILASPGKLIAAGSPVVLKRDLGQGYAIQVTFKGQKPGEKPVDEPVPELLSLIRSVAPNTYVSTNSASQSVYHLRAKDTRVVQQVLSILDQGKNEFNIEGYDILGTTIEDIFLDLMAKEEGKGNVLEKTVHATSDADADAGEAGDDAIKSIPIGQRISDGRPVSPLNQALTILYKRFLIAKRAWITPFLTLAVAILGSIIPLILITTPAPTCSQLRAGYKPTLSTRVVPVNIPLYLPDSSLLPMLVQGEGDLVLAPKDVLGDAGINISAVLQAVSLTDQAAFNEYILGNRQNIDVGGIFVPSDGDAPAVFTWDAEFFLKGLSMLNLASNVMYRDALAQSGVLGNATVGRGVLIKANYEILPAARAIGFAALRWAVFFSATMAVYPAFFSLYVARERKSSVQAMQMSNGLTNPVGLWLGHLLWDTILSVVAASIITPLFLSADTTFYGLGYLWLVMVLYGIAGALFAYCISLAVKSPLAAFAATAGYQIIYFLLYLTGYMLPQTYAKASESGRITSIVHYAISVFSPLGSIIRASFVSVNMFSLYCDGSEDITPAKVGNIARFGGPILYLIVQSCILFAILLYADSGSILPRKSGPKRLPPPIPGAAAGSESDNAGAGDIELRARTREGDIAAEAIHAAGSSDLLRVLGVSKTFGKKRVVDDVSLSVSRDTVFALLGPNGAGKTTTFNMIRGDMIPDTGDVYIDGTSVIRSPQTARLSLGVCPQFTAIDSQLTVRQHLTIYGRLKGLRAGAELQSNIATILEATGLERYHDRLASKLSGGNQRKLALGIALIGNPPVILIDEFSTGVDAKMKREMWQTLRSVSQGKAVIITTHSMEEASALANKVGILAKRMLAIGTSESLSSRFAVYEIHFVCRSREDVVRAQKLMARIPGSRMAEDVATRFEVPINSEYTLASLFQILSSAQTQSQGGQGEGGFTDYTVEKATLESVFMKVIRQNNVAEDDSERQRRWWWLN